MGGYVIVARIVTRLIRDRSGPRSQAIRLGYAAAAVSAAVAGLMWPPERFRSALEGLLTLGVTSFVLLGIARQAEREDVAGHGDGNGHGDGDRSVPHSWIWISACAVLFGAFLLIQARGRGPMAMSALSR